MKLDLNDLKPKECLLELSDFPGKKYTVKKFSLAMQIWMRDRFGPEGIGGIFKNQKLPEISEIVHHLLKDTSDFPTLESFQEAIVTQQDRVNVLTAVLETIGISQPVIKKLSDDAEKKTRPPKV